MGASAENDDRTVVGVLKYKRLTIKSKFGSVKKEKLEPQDLSCVIEVKHLLHDPLSNVIWKEIVPSPVNFLWFLLVVMLQEGILLHVIHAWY